MSEPKKTKSFSIEVKMDILAQVDPNKETQVAPVAKLETVSSALNSIINNRKDIRKC
jgi:hypothetical protein